MNSVGAVVTVLARIQYHPGSSVGQNTDYPHRGRSCPHQRTNARIEIRLFPVVSNSSFVCRAAVPRRHLVSAGSFAAWRRELTPVSEDG
jgi:hypothetical protein